MNLFKSSLIYIITDTIFQGLPFILLPILSYYILPAEYGLYTNFLVLLNLYSVLISFSFESYYGVNFYNQKFINNQNTLFKKSLMLLITFTIITSIITALLIKSLSGLLLLTYNQIYIALFSGFAMNINSLYLTKLRFLDKIIQFASIRISQSILRVLLSLFLVISLNLSWEGYYLAQIIPFIFIAIIIIIKEIKIILSINWRNLLNEIKEPFYFGITLMPHAMSSWIKTGLDKVLLTNIVNLTANGIYSTAFQFSLVLSLIGVSFNKAFSPYLFKNLNIYNFPSIKKVFFFFIIANLLLTATTIIILPFVLEIFFSEKYKEVIPILPYVITGQFFLNIYVVMSNILFHVKKTLTLSLISVFSAIIHTILIILLVKKYSETGVAFSFCVSAFLQFSITGIFSFMYLKKIKNERDK